MCMIIDGSPPDVRGGVECVFKLKLAENYFWLTEEKVNKREPTLQANSKFGLCYTPCILTLMYG